MYLSLDIGGTSTKLALVKNNEGIVAKGSVPVTDIQKSEDYFQKIFNYVVFLQNTNTIAASKIKGVGISVPGFRNEDGTIANAVNLPYLNKISLEKIFSEYYHCPTFVEKDSNAAALGEGWFGAARHFQQYIVLTLGTGLGCSVVVNGLPIRGNLNNAGEYGHSIFISEGRHCNCGQRGCIETYVSATGLKRTFFELIANYTENSSLSNLPLQKIDAHAIFEAVIKGDKIAKLAFEKTATYLARVMANLVTIFEPEAFILAGGLASAKEILIQPTQLFFEEFLLENYRNKTKILCSELDANEAALLGAARLIEHRI